MRDLFKFVVCLLAVPVYCATVGVRPYELDWAGRTSDDHPALIEFENLDGWSVECHNAEAVFSCSQEQKIWGDSVGKIVYKGAKSAPSFIIKPPAPVKIPDEFDAVSLWVYGNNFLARDKTTPSVTIYLCFKDKVGKSFDLRLINTRWEQWFLCHRRLSAEQIQRVKDGGAVFCGIRIAGGKNTDERVLYFDNLSLFKEEFKPISFKPRAKRGVQVFPGCDQGVNVGEGTLPFPNRNATIVPKPQSSAKPVIERNGQVLQMQVPDGLNVEISLNTFQWDNLRLRWTESGSWIKPSVGGGLFFVGVDGKPVAPETVKLLDVKIEGDKVICSWQAEFAGKKADVNITWWMLGQSLVADVAVEGGVVEEVRFGKIAGVKNPRLVTLPYYTYGRQVRPAVAVIDSVEKPLFLAQHVDWTLSNASTPFAINENKDGDVAINGGTRYFKKTNGERNSCYERFVFSLSPSFSAVLPEIPNPISPWKHVTGRGIWRAHGASNRESDTAFWREMHRYGLRELIITDHETGWRDEHESFTFRTNPAPKKGGDKGQFDYARIMQDELGYVYGPYNNFTDFAPVNEFWSTDMISRLTDNQLQTAWARCYAPKPLKAVEYCEKLAPIIESKFHFSTAYCDVHTAVTPWSRTDYDWRVPGAGTFAQTFYAYGEIMLLQKKAWEGPVYSEGNNHFLYCGLTDGNYAQDQRYNLNDNPWLVDFDLRRMHDLCCNFGVGNIGMFFGRKADLGRNKEEIRESLDRFLAATIAFGHPGFMLRTGGIESTLRSYYMLQQIQERYTQVPVKTIRYFDGLKLLSTSAAVASGAYKRNQLVVEYEGGVNVVVNGNQTESLKVRWKERDIVLPPNGYAAWTDDGEIEVYSGLHKGRRIDYARTPEYIYFDGRGEFTRYDRAAASGVAVCRFDKADLVEIIPVENRECGFAISAKSAVALDKVGESLGPARLRCARGLTYIVPVEGAFSYRVELEQVSKSDGSLICDITKVISGQTVHVKRQAKGYDLKIPVDAVVGERIWKEFDGEWIDFSVAPLCRVVASVSRDLLRVALTPNINAEKGVVKFGGQLHKLIMKDGKIQQFEIPVKQSRLEMIKRFVVDIKAGPLCQSEHFVVTAANQYREFAVLPDSPTSGMCLKKSGKEVSIRDDSGARVSNYPDMTCGEVTRKSVLFMHPPYKKGEGYTFVEYESLVLPKTPAAFRCMVGKGDGSDIGDGIEFRVVVTDADGKESVACKQHLATHKWLPIEVDLTAWAGQSIQLKLITDAGGNTSGDWGGWVDMRLETLQKELVWTLLPDGASMLKPSPYPLPAITVADLQGAKSGVIRYQAIGMAGKHPVYGSFALLNESELGNMKPASGDERNNIWSKSVTILLSPEALKSLQMHNVFEISNPGNDCFKVRNICLELELADGCKAATLIHAGTITQPGSWPYAEGVGVSHGDRIRIGLWFTDESD
ncbi:MAG: hypothetical protein PF904_09950 [Kiritimatiellae bacterium]|jgi:hypothetical protein|nr:hypothetical protein [Kiritimatiellia bacterium]